MKQQSKGAGGVGTPLGPKSLLHVFLFTIMILSDYLISSKKPSPNQTGSICEFDTAKGTTDELARLLAHWIVEVRCKFRKDLYDAWAAKLEVKQPHADVKQTEALGAFLSQPFGKPGGKPIAKDHIQSRVAEYLWYVLMLQGVHLEQAVYVDVPKFHATAPGADGFSIHDSNGTLCFKLWEIKKSINAPGPTLKKATEQLNTQALEYLAQLTSIVCTANNSTAIHTLGSQLVDKWLGKDQEAGFGVSVTTSQKHVSAKKAKTAWKNLDKISSIIPGLSGVDRVRGILVAVGDFSQFSEKVLKYIHEGM